MPLAAATSRRPLLFIGLLAVLSLPFYLLGDRPILPPSWGLRAPGFVAATVLPLLIAHGLLWRERGSDGVRALWRSLLDPRRIADRRWFIPILMLMPAVMTASFILTQLGDRPIADPRLAVGAAPLLFAAFVVLAACEEAGWSGYLLGGLQARWNALASALILGVVWAAWHVIPYAQLHPGAPGWVVWQCVGTIALRVLMVWIFNNTGGSLLAVTLFHAMINESEFLYPTLGSHYDPLVPSIMLTALAALAAWLWGGRTLARYRFGPASGVATDETRC